MRAALKVGGRFAAQCGGEGNIDAFRAAAEEIAKREPYREQLGGVERFWNYAAPEETEQRLRAAGFDHVHCWLEPWPVHPPEPFAFTKSVCLGPYVAELPGDLGDRFVADVLATQEEPLGLDYVRLNIEATAA